jgi:secondary thiamine-phosphate synthase enzyme
MSTTFSIQSHARNQMIDITAEVAAAIGKFKAADGLCTVYCPHTTAGITINENADPSVSRDLLETLNRLVPADQSHFTHSEGNSDSHVKSTLVGCSAQIPVKDGHLQLGTWQAIYFAEFDGPRTRQVVVAFTR